MTDFDIKVKNAKQVKIYGTTDRTVVLPENVKVDANRGKFDISVESVSSVEIGIPMESGKVELACGEASIDIRDLKFEEFEIDGSDDLSIEASGIEGSLEINLIGSAAELRVPSGYAFRAKNAGRGCRIEGDFAETPDSGNVIELNGKDSTLTIRT